jgi:hypothetical protein
MPVPAVPLAAVVVASTAVGTAALLVATAVVLGCYYVAQSDTVIQQIVC